LYVFQSRTFNVPVGPLRLLRMLRLARLTRLIRNIPELLTMTQGLLQGVRACGASIVMIFILNYIFAIVLNSILKDEDALNEQFRTRFGVHFTGLCDCMWILLVDGTFMLDGTGDLLSILVFKGSDNTCVAGFVLLTFLFLSAMVICNMLIGVLCEVVAQVAATERDSKAVMLLKETLLTHLSGFDDGDGMITKDELDSVLFAPASRAMLRELKIDRVFMLALQKMFFSTTDDSMTMPIKGVMELMLSCRADSPATVHTIANSLSYLSTRLDFTDNQLKSIANVVFDGADRDGAADLANQFAQSDLAK